MTSFGEFTVAGAISLRSRMRRCGSYDTDAQFEENLRQKLKKDYDARVQQSELKNRQLQATAENMRLSILGKDSKVRDVKPLEVVDAYVRENTTELVDPLDAKKKIEELAEKNAAFLKELDTQIKVSNATTFIEIV